MDSLLGVLVVTPHAGQVLTPGLLEVGGEVTGHRLSVAELRLPGAGLGAPEHLLPGAVLGHQPPLLDVLDVLGGLPLRPAEEVAHEPHQAANGEADCGDA